MALSSADIGQRGGLRRPIRVLLVEDNVELNRALALALESQFELRCAFDGKEALELLRSLEPWQLPDVVLADAVMPRMGGAALCEAMQQNLLWAAIPVVAMSGRPEAELSVITDAVLVKPFELAELVATLQRCALIPSR